jgi:ribonuclease Y
MELLLLLSGALVGALGGWLGNQTLQKSKSGAAEEAVKKMLAEAQRDAEKEKKRILAEADERVQFVRQLEQSMEKRDQQLENRLTELDKKQQVVEKKQGELDELKEAVRQIREKQEASLERIAKMTKEEAKDALLNLVEKQEQADLVKKMKQLDNRTESEVDAEARRRMATILARIASETTAESTVFAVTIPSEEMKGRLIGKEGRNINAFEKATGVDLLIDDSPDTVVVSSFDPVRREIGRVALEALIKDGRIQPARIEEIVKKATDDVHTAIQKAGEQAAGEAKVHNLPREVVRILGQLKYRTSYGQNMLAHSVEVSKISGMIAEEIGANAHVARTAGLLHDIGKALDHDIKMPHHHISADIAKKYKLSDDIVHAIIAHHDDIAAETTEAWIIRTADAISGARPGARRGNYEEYIERLRDLEKTAQNFAGVDKAFAIQAGREVRVFVRPSEVDDLHAAKLAKEIAAKIESELTYPGQVRVNVIRETRHQAFAA